MSKFRLFSNRSSIDVFTKWLTFFLIFFSCYSFGQTIQFYNFSQNQSNYSELENPTILAEATSTNGLWNERYDVSLPFSFIFNGTNYSSLKVHSYGFLTFGNDAPYGYVPISSSNSGYPGFEGAIAPFAGSITAYNFSSNEKGSVSYKLIGSAPNRKLIIQWKNYSYFYYNNLPTSVPQNAFKLNFQVHLNENGVINFVYDLSKTGNGSVSPASFSTQIGLRGLTNTDFTNRATTSSSATQNLETTTAGTSNSTTVTLSSSYLPQSGLTFTWTPPTGCNAPMTQPSDLNLTKNGIVINGSFSASVPTADKYLILRTVQGEVSASPVNGTIYSGGQNTSLNAYVVSYGSNTTFENNYNSGAIRGNNSYTYTIYSVSSNCSGGPLYKLQNPLSGTITNCPISLNGITTSTVTTNSFILNWSAGENGNALPLNRILEIATDPNFNNMIEGSPFTLTSTDLSLNVNGLESNTRYYYRGKNVTSLCESDFSTVGNLFTSCVPVTSFYENFDQVSGNVLPNCWSKITVGVQSSSVPTVNVTSTYANSAPNGVTFYGNGADMANLNNKAILVSPQLTNVVDRTHRLRFSAKMSSNGGTYDLQVVALSSNTADAIIEVIETITASELTPNYQEFSVNFNNYSGNANYVGIRRINGSSYTYLCVDDIIWEPIPSCPELQSVTTSNPTVDGVTVSWIESMGTPSNGYEYVVLTSNNLPTETDYIQRTTNTTLQLTGLTNGTYFIFVRRACSETDKSPWRLATFATIPTTPAPWLEEFGNNSPLGWETTGWSLGTSAAYPGNPGMNLHKNLYSSFAFTMGTFSTIPVGPLQSNNFEFSFDYRQGNYNSPFTPLTEWGNFTIEVSKDFGLSWTQLGLVDNEAGNQDGSYIHKVFSLNGYESEYVKIRITATRTAGDFYLSFDNFEIKQVTQAIESVVVATQNNIPSEIQVQNGTLQLIATVNPVDVNQEVIWTIESGNDFASVSTTGLVTANSNGTIVVRATSTQDSSKFGEIRIVINAESEELDYCIPTFFYPASDAGVVINQISLAGESITWQENPIVYNASGYADYTNSQSVDLVSGNAYTIDFHTDWQDPHFINVRAWIDFNQDYQFDADEEIGYNSNGISESGDGRFTFTVPENTTTGTYRLRVMLQFPNMEPNNMSSCGTINSYGIAIDYNLQITRAVVPADDYCAVTVEFEVEPITLVNFANINNVTSAAVNRTPAYEDFTSMVANVTLNETYSLIVKGNTNGNFEHDIRVFIDWNQDNNFDMQTEYYTASLLPSTGLDNVQVSIPIQVPLNATLGNTRMRIIKDHWNIYEEGEFDACTDSYHGQIEDYTINVLEQTTSVKPFEKNLVVIYPNPSTGIFNVSTEISIERIDIYSITGQRILSTQEKEINLSNVASGVYLLNVFSTNGTQNTYKVVKK